MKLTKWPAAVLCGIALAWPVAAQEEPAPKEPVPEPPPQVEEAAPTPPTPPAKADTEPVLHRWGAWTISLAAWEPTLIGADEELATTFQNGTYLPLMQGSQSSVEESVEAIYHLPKGIGSIAARYDAIGEEDDVKYFTPGNFGFYESRPYPASLGVFDDGTADGVASHAMRRSREWRLEFQKQAFDTRWARATWGVGLRSLNHARALGITYYSIVPNFPPAANVPEIFRLLPIPDQFGQTSSYSGSGLGASFNVEFPLHPRFSIVTGLSIGLYRGKAESTFSSQSSYYTTSADPEIPLTTAELIALLSIPTDPADPPPTADVFQQVVSVRLATQSNSLMAQSYDVFLGFQVTAWKELKVFGTLRDVYYANVGEYAIPTTGFGSDRKSLNAGYEGYTLGLSWRF